MSMDNIAGRIAARMLFTGRRDRAEVAREIAREDRQAGLHRRLRAASHPVSPQHRDDPRRTLIDRVMAMIDRLRAAPPPPPQQPSPRPVRRRLHERIADVIAPAEPKPSPATPRPPTIRSPGSNAVLIEDLPHRSGNDFIVDAWRNSILENERRSRPPGKTNLYIG
jgi:hypothetical protein